MEARPANDDDERVVALTPSGRDGALLTRTLHEAGVATQVCADVRALERAIAAPVGIVVVTEEALSQALLDVVAAQLALQPPWSDLPVLVLAAKHEDGRRSRAFAHAVTTLGNVTILERPLSAASLVSAVKSALRSRRRQYEARRLLERVELDVRRRDQFLAMLGHELRNPLGAISNASELVRRHAGNAERLERPISILQRQTRHLSRIVDDLLEVSRVSAGKLTLQRRLVDVAAVVESVVQQASAAATRQGVDVVFEAPGAASVDGDPVRLEQVFTNLVTNAIKYTPAGGRVTVRVEPREGDVKVSVRDSGVGIAPDMLPRVFDLFWQVEGSLDRSQGGLGIGLTLVQSLVRLHGGTVEVSSAGLGRGAEFAVLLPLAAADPAATPASEPARQTAPRERRVLIVDDSADNRDSLCELLEQLGHHVDVAVDGAEAVERVLSFRPDVALVDIGLPQIDGYEVARRVRARLGSSVLLVALSGYGQPEDRQRSAAAGFDEHVTKPADVDELARVIQRHRGFTAESAG